MRVHEIDSNVACEAYDCGFALSADDRESFEWKVCRSKDGERGIGAEVRNQDGVCRVTVRKGDGTGKQVICTEVRYF